MRLDRIDTEQLYRTHQEAFSDYALDASHVTEEMIRIRCVKNAVDFDVSVGAYDGERMVGFTLVAVDPWEGQLAAYDAGTGIIPGYRGKGLARSMFEAALPPLSARGVRLFLLEVLQGNSAAIQAYTRAGFGITRALISHSLDTRDPFVPGAAPSGLTILPIERAVVRTLEDQADWTPSWEVGFAAVERVPDDLVAFGAYHEEACVGAIAYTPTFRWIMTLLVHRAHRRRGIGRALVAHLLRRLPESHAKITLLNVDAGDSGTLAFAERLGFRHWVDQYEMARPV